jgi:hypothetical protein
VGNYQLVETVPSGFAAIGSFPGVGGFSLNAFTIQVALASGGVSANNRFLIRGSAVSPTVGSISGTVFQDVNANSFIDAADLPLQGATLQLFTALNVFIATTTSAVNGTYSFQNLPPGTYLVTQTAPAGFGNVNAFAGLNGLVLNPSTIQVVVNQGLDSSSNRFLDRSLAAQASTITGTVLRDSNGNGLIDINDAPVSGVTVQLQTTGGGVLAQTFTDATGAFAFPALSAGTYRVVEFVPAGLSAFIASSATGTVVNSTTLQFTVSGGAYGGNIFLNAGAVSPPAGPNTISGVGIRDTNLDGLPNGDLGLSGMVITLRNSFNQVIGTTVTDAAGAFSFPGLANGTYTLTATPPAGLVNTNVIPGQGGVKVSVATIQVSTSFGVTNYAGQQFLAGP